MPVKMAFCGIDCLKCPAFIAHQSNDDELRKKTAQEWAKMFDYAFKPEEINCVGCTVGEGVHIGYCGMCEIRACAQKKNVKHCGECTEYGCERLTKFLANVPEAKANLEAARKELNR